MDQISRSATRGGPSRSSAALPVSVTSNAVAAKAGSMPTLERLRTDDREDRQGRRKPSIQLDQEPAITIDDPVPARHLAPQDHQLVSECRILCFKQALRLEWRGQYGQDEAEQCKRCVH
jgi:hypothetical protein